MIVHECKNFRNWKEQRQGNICCHIKTKPELKIGRWQKALASATEDIETRYDQSAFQLQLEESHSLIVCK